MGFTCHLQQRNLPAQTRGRNQLQVLKQCHHMVSLTWPDCFFLLICGHRKKEGLAYYRYSDEKSYTGTGTIASVFEGCQHHQWPINNRQDLAILCTKRVMVACQTLFSLPTHQKKKRSGHTRLYHVIYLLVSSHRTLHRTKVCIKRIMLKECVVMRAM